MSTRRRPANLLLSAVAVLAIGLGGACSDDGDDAATAEDRVDATDAPSGDGSDGGNSGVGVTGGSASLTVDGRTWEFDQIQCAFGEEEIGIEGATWNMAARDGSLSFYVAIEPDADYAELAYLADDEAPNLMTTGEVDIELDGKRATGSAAFIDVTGDSGTELEGSFEVNCP